MMMVYGLEAVLAAALMYAFLGKPPGAVSQVVLGGAYSQYVQPLLVALLVILMVYFLDSYVH